MSKVIYGLLAIIGVIAVAAIAMAIAGLATSSSNQQQITSVQRSLSVGGATGGTVVSSGSYSIYITYTTPTQPFPVQTASAVAGTFTYTALSDSTGAVSFMRLILSPMSYTFTAAATATIQQVYFGNFSPTPSFQGFLAYGVCKPYMITTSNGNAGPFTFVGFTGVATPPGSTGIFFYPGSTSISIVSGYTLSLSNGFEMILGTTPN